jgi:5-methylcytosine-specific restriction enzyme A
VSRELPEWIGATDDQAIPPRVKLRIFEKALGRCKGCGLTIRAGTVPAYDHIIALVNGGENRERNIQLLCQPCHAPKTKADVAKKSLVYRKKAKHLGIRLRKSRPIPGSKASGLKKGFDGIVRRR